MELENVWTYDPVQYHESIWGNYVKINFFSKKLAYFANSLKRIIAKVI